MFYSLIWGRPDFYPVNWEGLNPNQQLIISKEKLKNNQTIAEFVPIKQKNQPCKQNDTAAEANV